MAVIEAALAGRIDLPKKEGAPCRRPHRDALDHRPRRWPRSAWLLRPRSPKQAAPAAPSLAPAVTVVRAAERELVERAVVTGTLVPREEILVAPEVEGLRITEVLVEEGAVVKQGQVLARLSRDILEATLAQNTAALARAEAAIAQAHSQIVQAEAAQTEAAQALERARALMRSGNTTEAQLEQRISVARAAEGRLAAARNGLRMAEAEKRSAEALRREIEVRLDRTEIKAPRAGIVSRKTARIGATAAASGDPLFRIIAEGEIELEGEVTETQILRIREGAPAEISLGQDRAIGAASATCCRKSIGRPASARSASRSAPTRPCASAPSRAARSNSPDAPASPSRPPRSFSGPKARPRRSWRATRFNPAGCGPACRRKASSRSRTGVPRANSSSPRRAVSCATATPCGPS